VAVDDYGEGPCELCGEAIPKGGGYGSGSLADGLFCSLRCYALKDDRYVPLPTDLINDDESTC
jgi:hypothetical protein